ncbi:RNA polymerase sigma factor [Kibdelosporangium phytohabitans]|uniref:RNA polymerase sigma factor n=1 Tax=Kibdelosporangium phytohabitans TaxID=860235 RepID=UPI002FF74725
MPPRQRAVLVLRIVHDLSIEQVAEAMRCSTGTVRCRSTSPTGWCTGSACTARRAAGRMRSA